MAENKKLILFIYRTKGARCNPRTLYDHLHGYSEVRIKRDEYGGAERKKYSYPGIPHHDIAQQVLVTSGKNARAAEELFNRFDVSYIKCRAPIFVRLNLPPPAG